MKTALHRFFLLWTCRKSRTLYCFLIPAFLLTNFTFAQTVTTGKSFVNITRPNGGTFAPGDIIEVRATIAVTGGSTTNRVTNIRYNDTVNTTSFNYITGSLQILSNEGRPQQRPPLVPYTPFTEAADTDSASVSAAGYVRFNIGNGAGACNVATEGNGVGAAGSLWGSLRPTFYGGTCIRMYVFRVQVKAAPTVDYGMVVSLNSGNFRYTIGSTNYVSNFSTSRIRISQDFGLCSNATGTNAIVGESGGTFGSGTAQNRAGGTTFVPAPYTFVNFSPGNPNDNYYGLANRTSTDGTTNNNVPYSSGTGSASRMFGAWDIIGDHTNAVNPALGNPATNTGYAVIINASYETNRAFTQNIGGLCEETYYEFSAWFRNICRRCGCDSSGKGATTTNYAPGPGNDSSGVRPNLSFQIDGEDVYTTGNIAYSGIWVKKGFVFKTRTGQNSMTVTIRNNAPGGGGNDWAIDDIGVLTCLPNMRYSPSITPTVCVGNALQLRDTVRSYFNNYRNHQWQQSTDGGVTWANIGIARDSTPYFNAALNVWEYVSRYTIPATSLSDNGKKFRVLVATSPTNLTNSNCRSTDATSIVTLSVIDCGPILSAKLISFNGTVNNSRATLKWTTSGEKEPYYFDVEKSSDGTNFSTIATINSYTDYNSEQHYYSYTDPNDVTGKVFYRINMRSLNNSSLYSRMLTLSGTGEKFALVSLINPFKSELLFDLSSSKPGMAKTELVNAMGNSVKRKIFDIREGVNQLTFDNMGALPAGIYILKIEYEGTFIYKNVMKQN